MQIALAIVLRRLRIILYYESTSYEATTVAAGSRRPPLTQGGGRVRLAVTHRRSESRWCDGQPSTATYQCNLEPNQLRKLAGIREFVALANGYQACCWDERS